MRPRAYQIESLILASGSPQRRQLLSEAGYHFEVVVPDERAEDGLCSGEGPAELVTRLARQKAADVARRFGRGERIIVACDTVAECQGEILGKPVDRADALRMLQRLAGQRHRVYSGLCLWPLDGRPSTDSIAVTELEMEPLSEALLDEYLDGGQWEGKAGAFGFQDRLGWVRIVTGSESNVVGMPLELLAEMLGRLR